MNLNINPKVVYAALAAGAIGGLSALLIVLQAGGFSTTSAALTTIAAAFGTGFVSGLSGWLKDQGAWAPVAPNPPVTFTPPPAPPPAAA